MKPRTTPKNATINKELIEKPQNGLIELVKLKIQSVDVYIDLCKMLIATMVPAAIALLAFSANSWPRKTAFGFTLGLVVGAWWGIENLMKKRENLIQVIEDYYLENTETAQLRAWLKLSRRAADIVERKKSIV